MPSSSMLVRFWGVRGSISCPGPDTLRYGGNTACVEVRCGDDALIFDAGSGIRLLGNSLAGHATNVDIFFSHLHIDHLTGLPFFAPLFEEGHRIRLWAGNLQPKTRLEDAVRKLMSFPLFPIELDMAKAEVEFRDFHAGDRLDPRRGIAIRTAALKHPGGAVGYRVDYGGGSVAYLTDLELGHGDIDPAILALARNASVLIVDTTYTDDELPQHIGWGHSSWQQAVRLAKLAQAKTLCLFHHDPEHDDAFMDGVARDVSAALPGSIVASEGLTIEIE